jgi:DNA-binding response OmpR family regulator
MVLDVKMPGLDGFEVLDRLRKDARFGATAVVMLTSMGQEADVVRGFSLGADDYVLKPFSPVELTARVRRLLQRGRSPKAI